MNSWITCGLMIIASYLVGSIPLSFLAGRSRGIDLRKQGTQQVGGGNLWRTTSRRLGLFVGLFDFFKGAIVVAISWQLGLDAGQQLFVGLAAVIGHNWPVFLRFHGGRGIATMLGIIIILPCINRTEITTWPVIGFFASAIACLIVMRRTPVPILVGLVLLPILSAIVKEPLTIILGYAAMTLIIVIKRLIAQPSAEPRQTGMARLLLNRFLFDRDVRYRADWVHRRPTDKPNKKE